MTVTVTPTVEASTGYGDPWRVRLDVADDAGLTAVTVTRLDPDGRAVPVRTTDGNPLTLSAGVGLVYDYEAPFGQPISYSTLEDSVTVSAGVTVEESRVWLIHPGVPEISMPVEYRAGSFDTEEWAVEQAAFYVMGREFPVLQTDGVRKAPQSSMTVAVSSLSELAALRTLVADISPLLLNVPPALGLGVGTCYIAVGAVRNSRLSTIGAMQDRNVELPFMVVDRPAGGTQAERTYVDLLTSFSSYAELPAAYGSYFQLLAGP